MSALSKADQKRLQKIIYKLQEAQREAEEFASERETYYDERSEKWQESDKGEDYQTDTESIAELGSDIENAISAVEDMIEVE